MKCDVVIVGAGAAGLAAAAHLVGRAGSVVVLEARTRLGGRIWSHRPWRTLPPIDLGAEFIHGSSLARKLDRSGLIEKGQSPEWESWERCRYTFAGQSIDRQDRRDSLVRNVLEEEWYARLRGARGSVRAALKNWPWLARRLATAEVEGLYAASTRDLSAKAIYDQWRSWEGPYGDWWPSGGYRSLLTTLREKLPSRVRTGDPVRRIGRSPRHGQVTILTRKGRVYEAERAIVTLPLGVLQADEIEFSPALSRSKWDAIRGIGMGDVIKVAVRCEPVWGDLGFIQSDTDIPVWWPLPSKVADDVIIGWAAGPAAGALRGRDIKQVAWSSLRRLFPRIRPSPGDVCVVDWGEEPFTLGAYSYDRSAHGTELRHELARPEDGLLFFAGEATEPLFYGTVHGAVKSGQTAADKVCRSTQA